MSLLSTMVEGFSCGATTRIWGGRSYPLDHVKSVLQIFSPHHIRGAEFPIVQCNPFAITLFQHICGVRRRTPMENQRFSKVKGKAVRHRKMSIEVVFVFIYKPIGIPGAKTFGEADGGSSIQRD